MIHGTFRSRSLRQSIDWSLIACYLVLVVIGVVNIYASIHSSGPASVFDPGMRSGKQSLWILAGLVVAAVILFLVPARLWENLSLPGYFLVLLLLVAVIFLGTEVKGSHSWFSFGPIRFQPAEVSKISTSLAIAYLMSRDGFKISRLKHFLLLAATIGLPMLIILAEKEAGSAFVYAGFLFVLYREGLSGWLLVAFGLAILLFILTLTTSAYTSALVLLGCIAIFNCLNSKKIWRSVALYAVFLALLAALPALLGLIGGEQGLPAAVKPIYFLLGSAGIVLIYLFHRAFRQRETHLYLSIAAFVAGICLIFSTEYIFDHLPAHQQGRIEVLLGIRDDPTGAGYNVNQSMIAIGSGGLTGKGFLQGTQTTYGFVPEQTTDFIFCTIGEEWGFVGATLLLLLYLFLMLRILYDAEKSRESFTRIYGYCVSCCLFMHVLVNIGMTIGLMPVIGIPLPLVSYGGSSLLTFTILLFIFIALDCQEKKYF